MKYKEVLENLESLLGQEITLEGTLAWELKGAESWYLIPTQQYQLDERESWVQLFWQAEPEEDKLAKGSVFQQKEQEIFRYHDYSTHTESSERDAFKHWTLYRLFGDSTHLETLKVWGLWEKLLLLYTEHRLNGTSKRFSVTASLQNSKYTHHLGSSFGNPNIPLPVAEVTGEVAISQHSHNSIILVNCHKVTLNFDAYKYHIFDSNLHLSTIPLTNAELHSISDYLHKPITSLPEIVYVFGWITVGEEGYFLMPHHLYTFLKNTSDYGISLQENPKLKAVLGQIIDIPFGGRMIIMDEAHIVGKIVLEGDKPLLQVHQMLIQSRLNSYREIFLDSI